jgi:hypothetical protein
MDIAAPLSQPKIDYVFFHWGQHVQLSSQIRDRIHIAQQDETFQVEGKIIFRSCFSEPDAEAKGDHNLPVLFPVMTRSDFYFIDYHSNLVFTSDVLKSVFYLLAGVQEISQGERKDKMGRFEFEDSIQCKGGFIQQPVVNYYFELMTEGLEKFCAIHQLSFKRRRLFKDLGFLLSHDIDRVDLYTFYQFGYHLKELLGLTPSTLPFINRLKVTSKSFAKYLGVRKDNPYWNFKFLREIERANGFTSTFFFLDQGVFHADAYHTLQETRMKDLFQYLRNEECEISMHGSVRSLNNASVMQANKQHLEEASESDSIGNRQHRLLWSHPQTALIEESIGLKYDATLGFASHEGFRNSYCYPFRLFDFNQDRMLNLWEFPLMVMDVTLFAYRQLSPELAMENCQSLLEEVKKFGGVFSLLWHNSFFDEVSYPGVTNFYKQLLSYIAAQNSESLTGIQLLDRLKHYHD